MEQVQAIAEFVGQRAGELGVSVGVAESLTGGLVVQALARSKGSSAWLRGGIVAYDRHVKQHLLEVDTISVVSEQAALSMAAGARKALGADVTVALTGAGGPDGQEGQPPGTVWVATDDGAHARAEVHHFDGDPAAVCEQARAAALCALLGRLADDRRPVEHVGG